MVKNFEELGERMKPLLEASSVPTAADLDRAHVSVDVARIRTRIAEARVRADSPALQEIAELCGTLFERLSLQR